MHLVFTQGCEVVHRGPYSWDFLSSGHAAHCLDLEAASVCDEWRKTSQSFQVSEASLEILGSRESPFPRGKDLESVGERGIRRRIGVLISECHSYE